MQKELRFFVARELRAAGSDKAPKIEGYAAVFGQRTDIGPFWEVIQEGAFTRTLASDTDVVCLFNHDENMLLGRKSAGTLTLEQDEVGLKFSCTLPDTTAARDTYANLKAGNLRECSFGFYVNGPQGESWTALPDGSDLRTLLDVTLFDVSVVVNPAYSGTSAQARNVVPDDIEQRRAAATRAASTSKVGEPVPFYASDETRDDQWDGETAANGIFSWADGDSDDDDIEDREKPVVNRLKAAQGFAYVSGSGEKRSDYLLPHHVVTKDGTLATHYTGALRAMGDLSLGRVSIPAQHKAEVRSHLQSELDLFQEDDGTEDGLENEIERSKARARVAEAKASL
jgi:HK97 family phage prohead protease